MQWVVARFFDGSIYIYNFAELQVPQNPIQVTQLLQGSENAVAALLVIIWAFDCCCAGQREFIFFST